VGRTGWNIGRVTDFANKNTGCPVKFEFQINKI
jgi:hypothetical protein